MKRSLLFFLSPFVFASESFAAWTPLISSGDFDGVRTDLLTTVAGIVTLLFIILGLGILYKVLR